MTPTVCRRYRWRTDRRLQGRWRRLSRRVGRIGAFAFSLFPTGFQPPVAATVVHEPHCALPATADSIEYRVYAMLYAPTETRYDGGQKPHADRVGSAFVGTVLRGIAAAYVMPERLRLKAYPIRTDAGTAPFGSEAVFGEVTFVIDSTGMLTTAELTQSSLSPALDQSLLQALRRAASAAGGSWSFRASGSEARRFHLLITNDDLPPGWGIQLFTFRTPVWHEVTYTAFDPRHPIPAPIFPVDLAQPGFQERLYAQYVVDEFGHPVMSTFRFAGVTPEWAAHPIRADPSSPDAQLEPFAWAVSQVLRRAHYIPATIGGCPAKMLGLYPFTFTSPETR
jgi:TonB family protein